MCACTQHSSCQHQSCTSSCTKINEGNHKSSEVVPEADNWESIENNRQSIELLMYDEKYYLISSLKMLGPNTANNTESQNMCDLYVVLENQAIKLYLTNDCALVISSEE